MINSIENVIIVPAIAGIVQAIKIIPFFRTINGKSLLPLTSVLLGVLASVIYYSEVEYGTMFTSILEGIVIGTSASGVYSMCHVYSKMNKNKPRRYKRPDEWSD